MNKLSKIRVGSRSIRFRRVV